MVCPPLTITREEIDEGIAVLDDAAPWVGRRTSSTRLGGATLRRARVPCARPPDAPSPRRRRRQRRPRPILAPGFARRARRGSGTTSAEPLAAPPLGRREREHPLAARPARRAHRERALRAVDGSGSAPELERGATAAAHAGDDRHHARGGARSSDRAKPLGVHLGSRELRDACRPGRATASPRTRRRPRSVRDRDGAHRAASGQPEGIEAREARDFEEFKAANRVAEQAFGGDVGMDDEQLRARYDEKLATGGWKTFVALVDGEIVASATSTYVDGAVTLNGGAVLPHARGRARIARSWPHAGPTRSSAARPPSSRRPARCPARSWSASASARSPRSRSSWTSSARPCRTKVAQSRLRPGWR